MHVSQGREMLLPRDIPDRWETHSGAGVLLGNERITQEYGMGRGVPENTQRRTSLWVLKNTPVSEHKTDSEVRMVVSRERVVPTWEVRPECLVKVKGECVPGMGTLGQGSPNLGVGTVLPLHRWPAPTSIPLKCSLPECLPHPLPATHLGQHFPPRATIFMFPSSLQ